MKVANIAFFCLCVLLHHAHVQSSDTKDTADEADSNQSLANPVRDHDDHQCLASLLVDQIRELQRQLQQQAVQQQLQAKQLQLQSSKLQEQSDEIRGLKEQSASMGTKLEWNTGNLTALSDLQDKQEQQASFRANLKHYNLAANTPIRFTLEFLKGPANYNAHSGVYVIPISGVYTLGFQLYPQNRFDYMVDLMINGVNKIRSRCSTVGFNSCAASSTFHLTKGTTVWVQTTVTGLYWDDNHSFFWGALISPDV